MKSMSLKSENILRFWGALDLFFILIMLYRDIESGLIPYYSYIVNSINTIDSYGNNLPIAFFLSTIILQLSIISSAVLLLLNHRWAKILCYSQIPFRLFLVVPSIPFILELGSKVFNNNAYVAVILLLLSEIVKFISLYRKL